jgi:hypothetical protein
MGPAISRLSGASCPHASESRLSNADGRSLGARANAAAAYYMSNPVETPSELRTRAEHIRRLAEELHAEDPAIRRLTDLADELDVRAEQLDAEGAAGRHDR